MSKAFPVAKDVFLKSAEGAEFAFRLKPPPAGKFAKAKTVAGTLDGAAVTFPTTNSKGWTPDDSILYYLWLTLADGRTGWITSDPGVPFVEGFALSVVAGETKRADPVRALKSGDDAPETRRLAGFRAAWAAKKAATPEAPATPEGETMPEGGTPVGAGSVEYVEEAPAPKKKGRK